MALPGYQGSLKIAGVAVGVTAEACTSISGANPNKLYQVTNTLRRSWDPSVAIVVKDGGVTVSSALYTFDYLFGFIQFAGYTQTGAITVDGSYLPTASIAEVKSVSIKMSASMLDTTTFDSAGATKKQAGLIDASGSFVALSTPMADFDPVTGGTQQIASLLANGTPKLLELGFGSGALLIRAWVLLESLNTDVQVDGLVESSWSFSLAAQRAGAAISLGS